jgi:hypothetical protein
MTCAADSQEPTKAFGAFTSIFDGLVGQGVTRVCFDYQSASILFEKGTQLSLDGEWELVDSRGNAIDRNVGLDARETFELWRVVGARAAAFNFSDAPMPNFTIAFDNSMRLKVINDDDNYEDWSLVAQGQEYNLIGFGWQVSNN